MSVAKIIEAVGSSDKSWEDAAQEALTAASKTIRNIVGLDVKDMTCTVKDNKIVTYKTNVKIAFVLEEE